MRKKGREGLPVLRNFPDHLSGRKQHLRQSRVSLNYLGGGMGHISAYPIHQFIIISTSMVKCDSFKATWYFLVAIVIVRPETGFEYLG